MSITTQRRYMRFSSYLLVMCHAYMMPGICRPPAPRHARRCPMEVRLVALNADREEKHDWHCKVMLR